LLRGAFGSGECRSVVAATTIRMRILWLSHFVPYPPAGGALQRTYHLLRHAAKQHEVHLISLHQPRLLPTEGELTEAVSVLSGICASVRVFPLPAERSAFHRW